MWFATRGLAPMITIASGRSKFCGGAFQTVGGEQIYAFALASATQVTLRATPTNPASSRIALYLRRDCEDPQTQVACASANGEAAEISELLAPGAYYLFVDDFASSIDEPQDYELSLELPE